MGTSQHSERGSASRIVAVVLAALVVGSAAVAGVAVLSTSGAAASSTTTASSSNQIKFAFVDGDDYVTFVREDGTKVQTNRTADIVGGMADLDGDNNLEAPFVTSQGEIWAIDANNETQFIANETYNSDTKLSIEDWTGDGEPEVVYVNSSDNDYPYYANLSGSPTQITDKAATSVLGVSDFTGSGEQDLVFIGSGSQNLWYYNSSAGTTDTGYNNFAGGATAGSPADFYRDGEMWVPAIDGSGYIELVNANGDVKDITTSNVDKTPVAGADWAGDSQLEVVVVKSGSIQYTHLNGTRNTLYDASGNSITANQGAGIAGVESRNETVLSVSNFQASAPGNQNVTVDVTTNEELSALNVSLSGPENATLTLGDGDFSTSDTSAPFTYTATYNGSSDGEYTATLEKAATADGDVVSNSQTDTVTVDDVGPSIDSAAITDATDGDGLVEAGDTVTVTATVTGDVGTVSADLSAFGAGSVTLTHASGDTYDASVQVESGATDGNHSVSVVATDGQGNQDTATTGTVEVDTSDLSVTLGADKAVVENEQVSFSPASVSNASGEVTFEWSFGDGGAESGESVTHTYLDAGTYTVTLTATDDTGATAEATVTVSVVSSDTGTDPTTTTATTTTATNTETTTESNTETTTVTTTDNPDDTETTTTSDANTETTTASNTETTTTEDEDDGGAVGEAPGFGLGLALIAMVGAALLARRS